MSKKALIIVDMLNDFVDEKGALYCGDTARSIIPFIRERLTSYRNRKDLVIYLQDSHDEDDKEFEKFPKHSITGTWGCEVIPELSPQAGEKVIPKKRYSGFFGTDIEHVLHSAGIDNVEVVGVCTSIWSRRSDATASRASARTPRDPSGRLLRAVPEPRPVPAGSAPAERVIGAEVEAC